MRSIRTIVIMSMAVLLLAGCPFPVPPGYQGNSRENLEDGVPVHIKSGETSREDVIMALGEPDAVSVDESWVEYGSAYCIGGMGVIVAGGGSAGAIAGYGMQYRRLIVRFDSLGFVTQPKFESETCLQFWGGAGSTGGETEPCLDIFGSDIPLTYNLPAKRTIGSDESSANTTLDPDIERAKATSASGHTSALDIIVTIDSGQAGFRKIETPRYAKFLVTDIRNGTKLERTGLGGMSMGKITLQPPAPVLVRLAIEAKLVDVLEHAGITEPQTVHCSIRIFDIKTPITLLYWDINTTIELVLRVGEQERIVTGTATERTYIWPSQEMIERVTTKALQQVSAEAERALIELFASHQ